MGKHSYNFHQKVVFEPPQEGLNREGWLQDRRRFWQTNKRMEMQVIRLSQSLKEQLLNIIDLHQGYFGEDCQTLLAAIQGVYCEKHIDKSCKDIINRVEQATGIGYSAMKARTRMRNVTIARHYAIYRVHRELYGSGYSLQDIGKMFYRDHSTVLYSIKTMKHALQVQDKLVKSIHTKYGELEAESA